ncbi:MAG TPA: galactokinase [Candidatus Kryptonia bacterium]
MESNSSIVDLLRREFVRLYGNNERMIIVRSPGRINLIGEHTDYNEGFVLPSAIGRAIYLAVAPGNGFEVTVTSLDFKDNYRFESRSPARSEKAWANYLIGVVAELGKAGYPVTGFKCVYAGDIPIGSGLSSSAAVESGLAFAMNSIFNLGIERAELARIAQRSENDFVGVRCGIMDQFANLMSKGESALHLDCRSLDYEYVPFVRKDLRFVLCDTGVKHSLASSEYNPRRQQCETGVKIVRKYDPRVQSLRDVGLEMLREHRDELGDIVFNRCSYVVEENSRVDSACKCLEQNDYARFGEFLYLSHQGLRDKYEVSCRELDLLVEAASKIDGVLGARMMGGGFGGCTLNLVERDSLEDFNGKIKEAYLEKTGKLPQVYECDLMPGTDVVPD